MMAIKLCNERIKPCKGDGFHDVEYHHIRHVLLDFANKNHPVMIGKLLLCISF